MTPETCVFCWISWQPASPLPLLLPVLPTWRCWVKVCCCCSSRQEVSVWSESYFWAGRGGFRLGPVQPQSCQRCNRADSSLAVELKDWFLLQFAPFANETMLYVCFQIFVNNLLTHHLVKSCIRDPEVLAYFPNSLHLSIHYGLEVEDTNGRTLRR